MKSVNVKQFKATSKMNLSKIPTKLDLNASEKKLEKELEEVRESLGKLQDTMYAHGKYSVLVCLQGMDTAGKDSLIREVFKDFNSRGIVVHSFKTPSSLELKHDFLWRHYFRLPARGKFGVFNRTHYENVLITRVHPEYLLNENLPNINKVEDVTEAFWDQRFKSINDFERHITNNGAIVFKFYLHLSKGEQRNRLLRRLRKENKHWKFSASDLKERKLWSQYRMCYEDAINRTSTDYAPWYVIPSDDKATARYIVARILYDNLKKYEDIKEPKLDEVTRANLELYKRQLEEE